MDAEHTTDNAIYPRLMWKYLIGSKSSVLVMNLYVDQVIGMPHE